jgi:hypothetical protein
MSLTSWLVSLRALVCGFRKGARPARPRHQRRLGLEALEHREVLSASLLAAPTHLVSSSVIMAAWDMSAAEGHRAAASPSVVRAAWDMSAAEGHRGAAASTTSTSPSVVRAAWDMKATKAV